MPPTSWLEISLTRLDANVACFAAILAGEGAEPPTTSQNAAQPATPRRAGEKSASRDHVDLPSRSPAPQPSVAASRPIPLLCGVVKADAYGLGAMTIAPRLVARGVNMLAVYSPAQAEQLVSLTLSCPLLVLMRMSEITRGDALYRHASTGRLHLTIHDREQLQGLDHAGRMLGFRLPVHLYVDTGMSRGGLNAEQAAVALAELPALRNLRLAGVYTHLSNAETDAEVCDEQVARLDRLLADAKATLPPASEMIVHVANTCAALRERKWHRGMARVGLGLLGYGPEQIDDAPTLIPEGRRILPIVRWLSRITHVQRYPAGTVVGYGRTHKLNRAGVLGVVPVGYGDGYPLGLSNRGRVGVLETDVPASHALPTATPSGPATSPRAARVLGRVNMDQIVIDLTDIPSAKPGTLVEVMGDDPAAEWSLAKLAKAADSHPYELLCRLSPRVPRKFVTTDAAPAAR
ncbi:MAG: alanine racemase [Planctomycetota bacterium]|nr:alanine racemase [Planctomycetota bacterium]